MHDYYKYRERAAAYEWYRTSVRIGLSEVCVVCQCVSRVHAMRAVSRIGFRHEHFVYSTVGDSDYSCSERKTDTQSAIGSEQTSILHRPRSDVRPATAHTTGARTNTFALFAVLYAPPLPLCTRRSHNQAVPKTGDSPDLSLTNHLVATLGERSVRPPQPSLSIRSRLRAPAVAHSVHELCPCIT